jgi:hypothetical protein
MFLDPVLWLWVQGDARGVGRQQRLNADGWGHRQQGVSDHSRSTFLPKLASSVFSFLNLTDDGVSLIRGISWATKDKVQQANYYGSLTQASTIRVGSYNGEEIYAPFKSLLPMVICPVFFDMLTTEKMVVVIHC